MRSSQQLGEASQKQEDRFLVVEPVSLSKPTPLRSAA